MADVRLARLRGFLGGPGHNSRYRTLGTWAVRLAFWPLWGLALVLGLLVMGLALAVRAFLDLTRPRTRRPDAGRSGLLGSETEDDWWARQW